MKGFRIALFALCFLLTPAIDHGQARAQIAPPPPLAPPPPGFVPPYEIMRKVRAHGLDPLAPPLREGTTYVLRATDFRGTLMRVVVDANTGTIRAVNRIVPPPMMPGQIGMMPPDGEPGDDALPPYGPPPEFDSPRPRGQAALPPPPFVSHPAAGATLHGAVPPLPRPRPTFASRQPARAANPESTPSAPAVASPGAQLGAQLGEAKTDTSTAAPAAPPASTAKPVKTPPGPPIND